MGREHMNTLTRMRAVLSSRSLYDTATALEWDSPVGRPLRNPPYVTLAYGVLARLARSAIRVQLDLAEPETWSYARRLMSEAITRHGLDLPPPGAKPPNWETWRWMRDHHLATETGVAELARVYPTIAVAAANRIGLLLPTGPGSFSHPDSTRTAYGDGTLVRPLYNPPATVSLTDADGGQRVAYPDPRTGELLDHPPGRFDPDLQEHHGRLGPVLTHGYVAWHARGRGRYQRIDLALAHVPAPGAEAATAVALLREVHRAAGAGIQAVVYDGAFRGVHIDEIMRNYGYLVLAKQATSATTTDATSGTAGADGARGEGEEVATTQLVMTPAGRRARSYPLGPVTHHLPTGPCHHQLATVGGQVVEIDLDEAGDPVVTSIPDRGQVKRVRRSTGAFHFNVAFRIECPIEPFTVWLSPHPGKDADARRPENLRIIPTTDPDAQRLQGIRSDAESFHSHYKRTLIVNRAMSLGAYRGLIDLYCFAIYNTALTEYHHAQRSGATSTVGPVATAARPPRPIPGIARSG
ncbi:hypothetical protein [Nocardioides halotolerans]|uniref:hypothetical protein n=1 Tax=Nocardioides halotolerans TaxID=433660 RepID=UPI00041098D9|nr:hypothetical protein [Nocardioides halotolerans]